MFIVAWDVETTGLDSRDSELTHVSFYGESATGQVREVLSVQTAGSEQAFLSSMDALVADFSPDVHLVTWNGSGFDIRFVLGRAAASSTVLGLKAQPVLGRFAKYPDEAGNPIPLLDGVWHGLQHTDIAYLYEDECAAAGERWGLKPTARRHGLQVVELDRTNMAAYTDAEIRKYVLSDAFATYQLAKRVEDRLCT